MYTVLLRYLIKCPSTWVCVWIEASQYPAFRLLRMQGVRAPKIEDMFERQSSSAHRAEMYQRVPGWRLHELQRSTVDVTVDSAGVTSPQMFLKQSCNSDCAKHSGVVSPPLRFLCMGKISTVFRPILSSSILGCMSQHAGRLLARQLLCRVCSGRKKFSTPDHDFHIPFTAVSAVKVHLQLLVGRTIAWQSVQPFRSSHSSIAPSHLCF